MPAKVREMRSMLTGKLEAREEEGSGHIKFTVIQGNTLVARTVLSRSYPEIDDKLLGAIARQLSVNRRQLDLLLQCPWSRDDYIRHVLGSAAL